MGKFSTKGLDLSESNLDTETVGLVALHAGSVVDKETCHASILWATPWRSHSCCSPEWPLERGG